MRHATLSSSTFPSSRPVHLKILSQAQRPPSAHADDEDLRKGGQVGKVGKVGKEERAMWCIAPRRISPSHNPQSQNLRISAGLESRYPVGLVGRPRACRVP